MKWLRDWLEGRRKSPDLVICPIDGCPHNGARQCFAEKIELKFSDIKTMNLVCKNYLDLEASIIEPSLGGGLAE